jgi:hypothetical protein
MHHWIGAALMIVGVGISGLTFMLNSSTPMQLGPVPFFAGVAVFFVGLLVWSF